MMSMTSFLHSSEYASPFTVLAYSPSAFAYFSKAWVLYQPEVPVLFPLAGLSNITPSVAAPPANAREMRLASP